MQAWEDLGRPAKFYFAEFGPGRGTMMADMLRAARIRPNFMKGAEIFLVETSPSLRALQRQNLAGKDITWADSIADIPQDAPLFAVGNEFFDAFPVRQFVKSEHGWHERMIGAEGQNLLFILTPDSIPLHIIPPSLRAATPGSIVEITPAGQNAMRAVAARLRDSGGLALFIDYGYTQPACGDSFQALHRHRFVDPLAAPGEADLTAHVDFAGLAQTARAEGVESFGPVTQGAFLSALGAAQRAAKLGPAEAEAVTRLLAPEAMGELFKVIALTPPDAPRPPGFPNKSL